MNRRTAHNSGKSPALTRGDDRPHGACFDRPFWFDIALDATPGSRYYKAATDECKVICASCDIHALCEAVFPDHPSVIAGKTIEERRA